MDIAIQDIPMWFRLGVLGLLGGLLMATIFKIHRDNNDLD